MRTLAVTFSTVALLLVVVFVVVMLTVRNQVREAVTANLESSQRMFAALEMRRQREMQTQAATIADSPTLVAAIDTIQIEARTHPGTTNPDLIETIDRELQKVAARVDADAIVLADAHGIAIDAAGRMADRWPRGRKVPLAGATDGGGGVDGTLRVGDALFRTIAVPLQLPDALVGTLYLATRLDRGFADQLARLSGASTAIVSDGLVVASTLSDAAARQFEKTASARPFSSTVVLDGESYAIRRLFAVGDTLFYALSSIDDTSRAAMRNAMTNLAAIGIAALLLGLLGSLALARLVTRPIGRLSTSLEAMASARDLSTLPLTGSSRELDALTQTFNELMASVAAAREQTEAAYTGAIRALAAALDARDPYTAGHSERVSVLSVAIGRSLALPDDDVEVLRLGALLHDIGKIGVPDDILRKPTGLTDAEFAAIKQHPVLGARILRSVPFLSRHIPIVELHHERPDGLGYPLGLRSEDIPLAAQIVHVADAYDAMTSARAYRGALPSSAALRELWRCAGTQFHAEIVGALANALPGVTTEVDEEVLEHA
jgi:putative nucleotidyltransferase with HDIG domain